MKQLEARRLNALFNSFVREQRDTKDNYNATLLVELTGIEYVGGITRDSNGDNLTVELQTKAYEAEQVIFVASQRSSLVEVYFRSQAYERGNKHKATVIVFKDSKGRRESVSIPKIHFGSSEDAQDLIKRRFNLDKTAEADLISELTRDLYYSSVIKKETRGALAIKGIIIEQVAEYSHKLWITPLFVKECTSGVEIGWMSFGTYASHPCLLKITKRKTETPLVNLRDIGAEVAGYYSHSNKHTCRPEQAEALKQFAKSFRAKASKLKAVSTSSALL
jgi:hypothetical protein